MSSAPSAPQAAIFIGRVQPFHNGHLALLRRALDSAPLVVVVIGSAYQPRTPRNPFTWQERAELVGAALPLEHERLLFTPTRDYFNEPRWTQAVRAQVHALLAARGIESEARLALVGHVKDSSCYYLEAFPEFASIAVERQPFLDGSALREAFFGAAGQSNAWIDVLSEHVPATTLDFLRSFRNRPEYSELVEEWRALKQYREDWAHTPYPPIFMTVDSVVRCNGQVLLVKRRFAPGRGLYALPGGFIEVRETAYQSALRELAEETSLGLSPAELKAHFVASAVFDHPQRSQRGRTLSIGHYFDLGQRELPTTCAGDDAAAVEWVAVERLITLEDQLLDDHFHMLDEFLSLL